MFHKLVKETIVQADDSLMITNMREAIRGTNVVLNLAVLPGVILIPSRLIILDKPTPGYNNQLTIAKRDMSFGTNEKVNYSPPIQNTLPVLGKKKLPKTKPNEAKEFHASSWNNTPKQKDESSPPVRKETTHKEKVQIAAAACVAVGVGLFLPGKKML